tara:strand:- start:281 stop:448 length:168 start_codon:yes stop_codon:yes gene_type:complete
MEQTTREWNRQRAARNLSFKYAALYDDFLVNEELTEEQFKKQLAVLDKQKEELNK